MLPHDSLIISRYLPANEKKEEINLLIMIWMQSALRELNKRKTNFSNLTVDKTS